MNHWVMDYETVSNTFVAYFEHYKEDKGKIFIIHKMKNDYPELLTFLLENKNLREWHVSFNGLAFDSQVTEFLIRNAETLSGMDGETLARRIYGFAQEVIRKSDMGEFPQFGLKDLNIRQVDVYKLNHWDNPAKRSSLKWVQYSMDWKNLQEMPLPHNRDIDSMRDLKTLVEYCVNDVRSTKEILKRSSEQVNLRNTLSMEYRMDLYSSSEPRIAKELFLMFLSKRTGIKTWDLRKMRTFRNNIVVKDIILPYVKFRSKPFQDLLKKYEDLIIDPFKIKGQLNILFDYKGVETTFALGGVHGANVSGVYSEDQEMMIMTSDVTSFYPNLAIRNKWSPKHIPTEDFCEQYEWFFDQRVVIPKKDPKNYVFKIILNSTYGLSNDANSFLYDPEFTMRITINGQLSLAMLYEMVMEEIPEAVPIMQNTDGLEFLLPRSKRETYLMICDRWEETTKLKLEHDEYSKLYLADVNNYIAVHPFKEVDKDTYEKVLKENPHALVKMENSKYFWAPVKTKGRFEFHNLPLHKNKSTLVIRKAIYQYLVHNVPPEKYISQNKNIFDYCFGEKIKGNWEFSAISSQGGEYREETLQKVIRYYISKKGVKLVKKNKDDKRQMQLVSGKWMQTLYNYAVERPWEDYNIDTDYYIKQVYREIAKIMSFSQKPKTLF